MVVERLYRASPGSSRRTLPDSRRQNISGSDQRRVTVSRKYSFVMAAGILWFGESSHLNACFILNSPDQIFVTAGDPPEGKPDYHRPDLFPPINPIALA